MNKSLVNFMVDCCLLTAVFFLGSTAGIMRFVLPPGSGQAVRLWGMDRHEWGQIHFWIAVALLSMVTLHLALHWRWIANMVKGRWTLAAIVLLAIVALAAAPFFGRVDQAGGRPGGHPHKFRGSRLLRDVEQSTGAPTAVILQNQRLPRNP